MSDISSDDDILAPRRKKKQTRRKENKNPNDGSTIYHMDGTIRLAPIAAMSAIGTSPAIVLSMAASSSGSMMELSSTVIFWAVGCLLAYACWWLGKEWSTKSEKEKKTGAFQTNSFNALTLSTTFFARFFTAIGVGIMVTILAAVWMNDHPLDWEFHKGDTVWFTKGTINTRPEIPSSTITLSGEVTEIVPHSNFTEYKVQYQLADSTATNDDADATITYSNYFTSDDLVLNTMNPMVQAYLWGIIVAVVQTLFNEYALTVGRGPVRPQEDGKHRHPSDIYIRGFRGIMAVPTGIFFGTSVAVRFGNYLDQYFFPTFASMFMAYVTGILFAIVYTIIIWRTSHKKALIGCNYTGFLVFAFLYIFFDLTNWLFAALAGGFCGISVGCFVETYYWKDELNKYLNEWYHNQPPPEKEMSPRLEMQKKKKQTAPIELQDIDAQALLERRRRVLYIGNQIRDKQIHGSGVAPAEPVLSLRDKITPLPGSPLNRSGSPFNKSNKHNLICIEDTLKMTLPIADDSKARDKLAREALARGRKVNASPRSSKRKSPKNKDMNTSPKNLPTYKVERGMTPRSVTPGTPSERSFITAALAKEKANSKDKYQPAASGSRSPATSRSQSREPPMTIPAADAKIDMINAKVEGVRATTPGNLGITGKKEVGLGDSGGKKTPTESKDEGLPSELKELERSWSRTTPLPIPGAVSPTNSHDSSRGVEFPGTEKPPPPPPQMVSPRKAPSLIGTLRGSSPRDKSARGRSPNTSTSFRKSKQ